MNETAELTGRELDRAVAEAMWYKVAGSLGEIGGYYIDLDSPTVEGWKKLPHYSTSLGDCEEILAYLDGCETLEGQRLFWSISNIHGLWQVHIDHACPISEDYRPLGKMDCDSLPEAICRAFLQAAPKLRRKTGDLTDEERV